jgi:hypothetical protein
MSMMWCQRCKENVKAEHSWNTVIAVVLVLLFVIPGLIYIAATWKKRCTVCRSKALSAAH